MFDGKWRDEAAARLDEMFERRHPSTTPDSAVLVERICSAGRAENRAAAAQLVAIGELFGYRLSRRGLLHQTPAQFLTLSSGPA